MQCCLPVTRMRWMSMGLVLSLTFFLVLTTNSHRIFYRYEDDLNDTFLPHSVVGAKCNSSRCPEGIQHQVARGENKPDEKNIAEKWPPNCIERNICKKPGSNSDVYFYKRTNFDDLVNSPVDYNTTIRHPYPVVPRHVHFCLFNTSTFRFHYMISVLAASRFVRPDKIFFWHDIEPAGPYWKETLRKVPNIYLVHRDIPTSIRRRTVKVVEHVADIVRLEALLEYGGMYFDTDSIVVNPIDPLLIYDVTMGHAVAWVLANGILFSRPWSAFFKIWHREYKTFDDKQWGSHSVVLPFKLSRKYPNLIHVEATSLCRPSWQELPYMFGEKQWDFQNKNFVVHLYMRYGPKGDKEMNANKIRTWNTTAGRIMRYIYYGNATLLPKLSPRRTQA